jgi:outer membrane protein TolC
MRPRARCIAVLWLGLGWLAIASGVSAGSQEPQVAREGRVASGQTTPDPLRLSLADVLSRGLERNLAAILGQQNVSASGGARIASRAGLLPNVSGRVSETKEQINLEAFGFPIPKGTNPIVGPFDVFEARLSVSQAIFDLSAIETARAGSFAAAAAAASYADVKDTVVMVCANLYLQAVIGTGRIEAVRAQLRTAEAVHRRAVAMKAAGVIAGIDVLRAEVQLQSLQQRVISVENELAKQKLALARAIGLPLGQPFELTDEAPYAELAEQPLDAALKQAYETRADLQSAVASLKAAEAGRRSILGEALPSLRLTADYGDIGNTAGTSKATFAVAAAVRIPLFQGGRVRGRLVQADAALASQRAQLDDLRSRIDFEIRTAYLDLAAADQRAKVARSAAALANQQLDQAQDRFAAGVANHLEVVQAQEAVAAATDNSLGALYAYNLAKLSVARALGVTEESATRYLGGLK